MTSSQLKEENSMALYMIDEDSFDFIPTSDNKAKGTSAQFGTVKLSDDPEAEGTAAQGMAASQKALSDGLNAVKNATDVTADVLKNTAAYAITDLKVIRNGGMVQIDCSAERLTALDYTPASGDTILADLPHTAAGEFYAPTGGAAGACVVTVATDNSYPKTGQTTAAMYVRSGPGATADPIGTLPAGDSVDIVYKYNNDWFYVWSDTLESYGYAYGAYLTITETKKTTYAKIGSMTADKPSQIHITYIEGD